MVEEMSTSHLPFGRWFELPDLSTALECNGLAILFHHGPPLTRIEASRSARMESDHSAWRIVQEVAVRFGAEIHSAKNRDRVILCAYRAFSLELLSHDRGVPPTLKVVEGR